MIRRRFFVPRPKFRSYAELNAWLQDRCIAWAKANPHAEFRDKTTWEVFEAERPRLVPYVGPFVTLEACLRHDGFHAVPAVRQCLSDHWRSIGSLSKTCLVRFDRNRYSVDACAVGRPVEIRAYADRGEFWQDGRVVGRHAVVHWARTDGASMDDLRTGSCRLRPAALPPRACAQAWRTAE